MTAPATGQIVLTTIAANLQSTFVEVFNDFLDQMRAHNSRHSWFDVPVTDGETTLIVRLSFDLLPAAEALQ